MEDQKDQENHQETIDQNQEEKRYQHSLKKNSIHNQAQINKQEQSQIDIQYDEDQQQEQENRQIQRQEQNEGLDKENSLIQKEQVHIKEEEPQLSQLSNHETDQKILQELDLGNILGQVKKSRKITEQESQILANRIAMLKQEELKSWKKIRETKRKTDEIFRLKKYNEKENNKLDNDHGLKNTQHLNFDNHIKQLQNLEKLRQQMIEERHQQAIKIKEETQKNEQLYSQLMQLMQTENRLKNAQVRKSEQKTLLKKESHRQKVKSSVQYQYRFEVDLEEAYRKKKEEEIYEMERLELELIKKLHNTQMLQKSAFEELENVLNLKASEFEKKYKKKSKQNKTEQVLQDNDKQVENKVQKSENTEPVPKTPKKVENEQLELKSVEKNELNKSQNNQNKSQSHHSEKDEQKEEKQEEIQIIEKTQDLDQNQERKVKSSQELGTKSTGEKQFRIKKHKKRKIKHHKQEKQEPSGKDFVF